MVRRSLLLLAVLLAACSPELNWRDVAPESGDVNAMFPCRPDRLTRSVTLVEASVEMHMLVCEAGGATYALSAFSVAEPAAVGPALGALQQAALRNIAGGTPSPTVLQLSGATPHPEAVRWTFTGRLPDGRPVEQHAAFFARDLRVYQASVLGAKPEAEAVDIFMTGLRLPQ